MYLFFVFGFIARVQPHRLCIWRTYRQARVDKIDFFISATERPANMNYLRRRLIDVRRRFPRKRPVDFFEDANERSVFE